MKYTTTLPKFDKHYTLLFSFMLTEKMKDVVKTTNNYTNNNNIREYTNTGY